MQDESGYRSLPAKISQGDVFANIPIVRAGRFADATLIEDESDDFKRIEYRDEAGKAVTLEVRVGPAVLVSNGCDIDKSYCTHVLVAPVWPLARMSRERQASVRKNKLLRCFRLPELLGKMPESVVDFGGMASVSKEHVTADTRIASINELTWMAFRMQLLRYFTRLMPATSTLDFPPSSTRDE